MNVLEKLKDRWSNIEYPCLIYSDTQLTFNEIISRKPIDLSGIKSGDVVALIGDFDPQSILTLLQLIDKKAIILPLTKHTKPQHDYFLETSLVDVVIEDGLIRRISHDREHTLINQLRDKKHPGLLAFSTGTIGSPKAILHDLTFFMKRFETPRPTLRTLTFLLFDHIGGLNTLLHTLFNRGTVVAPQTRNVKEILKICKSFQVDVLPTTPTFLRMMLMSGMIPNHIPDCLKLITYGTERMDQTTLDTLCELLPNVGFRQTFGMSELGVVRVKSKDRNSLFMKIGGEGIETRVIDNVLEIRSQTRMLGYLNADSPFDKEGWYNTKDIVEELDGYYKVIGRTNEVINVGGHKFMASDIEGVALQYDGIELAKAEGKMNPITGQHVELLVQPAKHNVIKKNELSAFLKSKLPNYMLPKRIKISSISVGHRFKRA